jgi:hypothetical protein
LLVQLSTKRLIFRNVEKPFPVWPAFAALRSVKAFETVSKPVSFETQAEGSEIKARYSLEIQSQMTVVQQWHWSWFEVLALSTRGDWGKDACWHVVVGAPV